MESTEVMFHAAYEQLMVFKLQVTREIVTMEMWNKVLVVLKVYEAIQVRVRYEDFTNYNSGFLGTKFSLRFVKLSKCRNLA
jgi:hypothetical protein